MHLKRDTLVGFAAYFVNDGSKARQRKLIAEFALSWLTVQKERGVRGRIMWDIDDTLINYRERLDDGFQQVVEVFQAVRHLFSVHIVTARPDYDKDNCLKMLYSLGICVDADRLEMLPGKIYDDKTRDIGPDVTAFKAGCFERLCKLDGMVLARFGDKLWDVIPPHIITSELAHVRDCQCYIMLHPELKGTVSFKLPGSGR